jgi:hypothetical protein
MDRERIATYRKIIGTVYEHEHLHGARGWKVACLLVL